MNLTPPVAYTSFYLYYHPIRALSVGDPGRAEPPAPREDLRDVNKVLKEKELD